MSAVKTPVYLDYAASTPVDPAVADKMAACLTMDGTFANPASTSHAPGRAARVLVEQARAQVAALINADAREIVWTSGATESDNLAIKGAAIALRDRGRHVVTSRIEHKAVLDTCKQLERDGFDVTFVKPGRDGLITFDQVADAIRDDTILVSIMHVNNEIGTINDIESISAVCCEKGVMFHVDAAQSAGKVPIDVRRLKVHMMSFSAHKIYGPKGIGALFVCRDPRCHLEPILHGGGHEGGLRSGTLATHQIVGMGEAFRIAADKCESEARGIGTLRNKLLRGLSNLGGVHLNGHPDRHVAGILNFSFEDVEGESLLFSLRNLAVSSGSACTSATAEPSYVLRALGYNDQLAQSSIRFSIGRFTTEADIDFAVMTVMEQVARLRELAPVDATANEDGVQCDTLSTAKQ